MIFRVNCNLTMGMEGVEELQCESRQIPLIVITPPEANKGDHIVVQSRFERLMEQLGNLQLEYN